MEILLAGAERLAAAYFRFSRFLLSSFFPLVASLVTGAGGFLTRGQLQHGRGEGKGCRPGWLSCFLTLNRALVAHSSV